MYDFIGIEKQPASIHLYGILNMTPAAISLM